MVADCDLALLHGFQKGRLHLGRGTVYLVRQHKVGENRAFLYLELLGLNRIYHSTEHIGRKEVGSKLYAAVSGVDNLRECLDGKCLGKAGNTSRSTWPLESNAIRSDSTRCFCPTMAWSIPCVTRFTKLLLLATRSLSSLIFTESLIMKLLYADVSYIGFLERRNVLQK